MIFNNEKINYLDIQPLRNAVRIHMSEERYNHTLSVEKEAVHLAQIFSIPESERDKIRAAALLHDLTKDKSVSGHLELYSIYGINPEPKDIKVKKTLHARTASFAAKHEFCADDGVVSAICNHTAGAENMPLFDKIIYLADYIEPQRKHTDCIDVRNFFYSRLADVKNESNRFKLLDDTMIYSIDKTIIDLLNECKPIHTDIVLCRNSLI